MRGILHTEDFGWARVPRFGGGGSNVTTTSQTKSDPWTGQQPYLSGTSSVSGVFPSAASTYENTSGYPQYYPYSTYTPMTSTQNTLVGDLVNQGTGSTSLSSANTALTDMLNTGTSNTSGAFNDAQTYYGNTLSSSFTDPWKSPGFGSLVNNTLATTIPAATSSFIGGGRADSGLASRAVSSGATDAVGELANLFYQNQEGLQSTAAGQASSNYLNQQKNVQQAALSAPSIDSATVSNLNAALTGAGYTQTDIQNQLNDTVSRWNYNQQLPLSMLDWYSNLVGGSGYGSSGSTLTTQPNYTNTAANIGSAATGTAALASVPLTSSGQSASQLIGSWIGSDRALKTDIHRIGESDSGFPLYTFRYKGEPPFSWRIGLMAQDVQRKRPEAVRRFPFGLAVDYSKALAA